MNYVALRVVSRVHPWWPSARAADGKPGAVVALLNGRHRVEVSAGEADAVLEWARGVAGWTEAGPKPISAHPSARAHGVAPIAAVPTS